MSDIEHAVMVRGHGKYEGTEKGSIEFNDGDLAVPVESAEEAEALVTAIHLVQAHNIPPFHYGAWTVSREVKRTDWT